MGDIEVIRLLYYLPMERMSKGDLLYIGTAYVEVHTFKGKDYITVKDFNTTTNALSKKILELEEEIKSLRDYADNLDSENDNQAIEIEELKKENKELQEALDHGDSFFSIMRDVLENEKLKFDFYNLREILYCVVHEECGDYNLNKNELEVVKKFWNREYV